MSDPRKVIPDLPDIGSEPSQWRRFLEAVREILQTREGRRGNPLDKAVTFRELTDIGVVSRSVTGYEAAAAGPPGPQGPAGPAGPAGTYTPDYTKPPTPTGLTAVSLFRGVLVEWDAPTYSAGHGNAYTKIYVAQYGGSGPLPTFPSAVAAGQAGGATSMYVHDAAMGAQLHVWISFMSADGVESDPAGGTNGFQITVGKVGNSDLGPLIIEAANLADGAITASKLAAQAVEYTAFAAGIRPPRVVAALPALPNAAYAEGDTVVLTTDGKLYRLKSGAWTAAVPTTDLTGTISGSQIADSALTAAKFASSIEPVGIVSAVPGTKSTNTIFNTTDGKLYRWNGSAYVASVLTSDLSGTVADAQIAGLAASKITGTISTSQIADAAITVAKFASTIEPVTIVTGALPGVKSTNTIFLTSDGKLYRWSGSAYVATVPTTDLSGTVSDAQIAGLAASKITGQLTDSQLAAIAAAKLTGQITTTQITDSAITTAKVAAGAITANEIAANTITAAKIAAGTITATELAAGSVTTAKIAAGAVTATEIAASTITGGKIAAGTITSANIAADTITAGNIAAGAISTSELAAGAITASKISITDTTNQVLNPSFVGGSMDGWTGVGVVSAKNAAGVPAGCPEEYCLSATILAGSNADTTFGGYFDVRPGDVYYTEWWGASENANANCRLFLAIGDQTLSGFTWPAAVTATPNGAWTKYSGRITIPATFVYNTVTYTPSRARIGFGPVANASPTGKWHATKFMVRKAATGELIVDGAITTAKLAAGAVTANEIAAATITGAKIAAGTIQGSNIAAGTIAAGNIAAGAITANELAANAVTAGKISAGAISATEIAASAITTDKLALNAVTTAKLAAGAVTANEIAANTITAGQIAAGAIGAAQIAAGAIRTDKLLVTGNGQTLNSDPNGVDSSAWTVPLGSPVFASVVTDAPGGGTCIASPAGSQARAFSELIPIDPLKNYRYQAYYKQDAATAATIYHAVAWYDAAGNALPSDQPQPAGAGSPAGWSNGGYSYSGAVNIAAPTTWTQYTVAFGPNETPKIPSNAKFFRVGFLLNANATASAVVRVTGVRVMEKAAADLIVDGSITATKIAANAIAVGTAAIQNGAIVNAMIASAAIDDAKIANLSAAKITTGTLDAARIAAGSLDASKITSGTITATQIASTLLSSDNVLTRNMTVRDNAGNVIFSSTQNLDISRVANAGAFATLSQITSANVSTYIAAAAIGWAQINDLVINTGGGIRSGKTSYANGTGWLLEYNAGTPRFDVGNSTQYLRFDGTNLLVGGDIIATGNIQAGAITAVSSATLGTPLAITNTTEQTLLTLSSINTTVSGVSRPAFVNASFYIQMIRAVAQQPGLTFRVKFGATTVHTVVWSAPSSATTPIGTTFSLSIQVASPPTGDFATTITVQCDVTPNALNEFEITSASATVVGLKR